jgi:hypothetical protein
MECPKCVNGMVELGEDDQGRRLQAFCSCPKGREQSAAYAKRWPQVKKRGNTHDAQV